MDRPNVEGFGGPDYRPGVPSFGEIVERSLALLERRRRVSHTALRLEFALDDATFAALREELVDVLGAAEDDGRVLVTRNGAPARRDAAPPAPDARAPAVPGPPAVAGERDLVTVLLCDLAESPELDALGADERARITARLHAICGEVAARRRGRVQPWVSDGVAIFFGHPRAGDDDALRAVRCGWEILRTLDGARALFERELGLRVAVRIAVATAPAADDADSFGDAPRIAGAAQAAGAPDRVTTDRATQQLASAHFAFAPVAGDGYELRGPLDAGTPERRAPTALVGRTGERALLRALAERAAGGTRAAILVRGEAGVGKTRLLEALAAGAQAQLGMTLLHCAASPYHRGSPLHPLLSGLRRAWQLDGTEPSVRLARHAQSLPGGERTIALLADLLGVAVPEGVAPLPAMSAQRRRRETLTLLAQTLAAEAQRAPLLLVVEDLHWADPTTLELITTLLDGPREVALMLALTARSEYVAPPSAALQRIELGRLDADESRRLVELVAADAALPEELAAELAARAGGSPLLVEELTRTVLATPDAQPAQAVTLYGCLMARLDRDTTARTVAQLAATVGREFDVALLEAAGEIESSALDWGLERLVEEDVVAPTGPGSYAFRHSLLQEAARSSLPKEALREHNLRIARALCASFPHVAAAEPERVARHLEYAGALPESVRRWQQAGLQALARHALREASGHFERGLELTARTADGDERRAAELSLRVLAGMTDARRQGWSSPSSVAHYARAEQVRRDVTAAPQLVRCMLGLTAHRFLGGRLEEAQALAREQVEIADRARDHELLLEAECDAGAALVLLGRHRDALPRLARAVELYDPAGHDEHARRFGRNPAAVALAHRGLALACRGDRAGARCAIAEAAAVLRAQPHPYSRAWVQCAAAAAAFACGERDVVRREASVAIALASEEGFGDWLAQGSVLHGWARVHAGEHGGLAECERGVASWASAGIVVLRPFAHGLLGDALRQAGDPSRGLAALDEALSWCAGGERWCEPELHRIRAELLLACGDRGAALRGAQRAVALARRAGTGGWESRALATLARVKGVAPVA